LPSTDHYDSIAEAGVGEANPIPTPLGHTWFITHKDQWWIRRQSYLDVHAEQNELLPQDINEFATFIQSRRGLWDELYRMLAFPQDGDFLQARKNMSNYQDQATKLLTLSQKFGGIPRAYMRREQIPPFLIGALAGSAKSALRLMTLIGDSPHFSFATKCDCILYMRIVHWSEINTETGLREIYDAEIDKIAVSAWPDQMPKSALLAMLNHSSFQRRREIIDRVLAAYERVPPELLLIIVDYYTKQNLPEDALAILSRTTAKDLETLGERVYGRYFNLIRIDTVEHSDSGVNFKIFPRLLEIGLPLTDGMHCELIGRAIKLGLSDVAWEVYRFMEANNMEVNAYGHLVLLRHSFARGDLDGLNLIMSKIYQRKDLVTDPYLVSFTMNIVRYVCYFERELPVRESWAHVLAVYDRAYDRAPLVKLGLVDPLPQAEAGATLPQPTGQQLAFTLWTYILIQPSDHTVQHFWHHFTHLVACRDKDMCEVARHDVLYNGLIIYWGRLKRTLLNAVEMLEEMERLGFCKPTEMTWIFLISAFMKHGQEASAERIRQMMIARGVESDPENWLWLLKEYSESNLVVRIKHNFGQKVSPNGTRQDSVLDWGKFDMLRAPV